VFGFEEDVAGFATEDIVGVDAGLQPTLANVGAEWPPPASTAATSSPARQSSLEVQEALVSPPPLTCIFFFFLRVLGRKSIKIYIPYFSLERRRVVFPYLHATTALDAIEPFGFIMYASHPRSS
jgi:hypothetical protein